MYTPLEMLRVIPILRCSLNTTDLSITNITIAICITLGVIIFLAISLLLNSKIIPLAGQHAVESFYEFSIETYGSVLGKRGLVYFPYIMALNAFITMANLIGGIPYATAITAQFSIVFALGAGTILGILLLAIKEHGSILLISFLPYGAPNWIAPILFALELLSFMFRPFSLSGRLCANIIAGHALIALIIGLGWKLLISGTIYAFACVFILVIFCIIAILEFGVQLGQAYVFTILTCTYLSDALYIDH